MKLYTRNGDDGTTGLFGGQRVSKDDLRVEAYGTVDELNSHVGLALAGLDAADDPDHAAMLTSIQNRLFEIGADLSTPRNPDDEASGGGYVPRIGDEQATELERFIDTVCDDLPEMKSFILPGGTELAARLHVARTVCRRAERLCVSLNKADPIGSVVIVYLNRLSDLLFALARRANRRAGIDDVPWVNPNTQ